MAYKMTEEQIMVLLCYAIAAASRPDSSVVLTERYLFARHLPKPARRKPIRPKNVKRWKGVYENKDTPIHRRSPPK